MQRIKLFVALALIGAIVALLAASGGPALGQSSTATAEPIEDVLLGQAMPNNAPGKVLYLERVTLAPGAAFPVHTHPGAVLIYVESGDFGFTVFKGEAQITRAGASKPETILPGLEVVGHQGDALFEQGGVVHSARNAGKTPAVILAASLLAEGQPVQPNTNEQGTPIAAGTAVPIQK